MIRVYLFRIRDATLREERLGLEARMNLLAMIFRPAVADAEIRAEIWRLGVRHVGWPLEGALEELREPNISMDRAVLLRACVDKLRLKH